MRCPCTCALFAVCMLQEQGFCWLLSKPFLQLAKFGNLQSRSRWQIGSVQQSNITGNIAFQALVQTGCSHCSFKRFNTSVRACGYYRVVSANVKAFFSDLSTIYTIIFLLVVDARERFIGGFCIYNVLCVGEHSIHLIA